MNAWAFLPWGFHKQSFWVKWALWPMTQYASISLSFLALESSSTQVQSDLILLRLTPLIRLQVLSEPVWSLWTHSIEHQLPQLESSSGACFQEPGLRSLWVKCLHAALCFYLVCESQNHLAAAAAAAKSLQSCPTLCDPTDGSPLRLLCPWDSPGKNTGVGCHFLLQCMKVKSESEVAQSCLTLSDSMDCSLPGSSVHRIFQARVLEWHSHL